MIEQERQDIQKLLAEIRLNPNYVITATQAEQLKQAGYTGELKVLQPPTADAPAPVDARTETEGPDFSKSSE